MSLPRTARTLVLLALAAPAVAGPKFKIFDLGNFEGDPYDGITNGGSAFAQAISPNGAHIGGVMNRGPVGLFGRTVVRFQSGFAVDVLPFVADPGITSGTLGVLDDGTMLIKFDVLNPDNGAFYSRVHLLPPAGAPILGFVQPPAEAPNAAVSTMNALGRFAGSDTHFSPALGRAVHHLVRWSGDRSTAEVIPTLGGPALVTAMNAQGEMVGTCAPGSTFINHPFVFRDGQNVDLSAPYPTHRSGAASDINDHGQIVGNLLENALTVPATWSPSGERTLLPLLPQITRGGVLAINNQGLIVGQNDEYIGTLWYEGTPYDLNEITINAARWVNVGPALAISENNIITGYGTLDVNPTFTDIRAYRLIPICDADLTGSSDPFDPAYGDPDGAVDAADFFYYLDAFVAGDRVVADLTGASDPNAPDYGTPDGALDTSDFFFFLDRFTGDCWR